MGPTNPGPAGAVAPGGPPGWNDPAAFAATAPPPTTDEHDKAQQAQAQQQQHQASPAPAPVAPPPPAPEPVPAPAAEASPKPASESGAKDPMQVAPDAPRALAGFLVGYEGAELGIFWPVYQGKNVVGRKAAADGLDIEVDHPTTSSRHAIVHASARPGRFKVEDQGSTNGTFVNDEKLAPNAAKELVDGDQLRFGGYAVTVKIV